MEIGAVALELQFALDLGPIGRDVQTATPVVRGPQGTSCDLAGGAADHQGRRCLRPKVVGVLGKCHSNLVGAGEKEGGCRNTDRSAGVRRGGQGVAVHCEGHCAAAQHRRHQINCITELCRQGGREAEHLGGAAGVGQGGPSLVDGDLGMIAARPPVLVGGSQGSSVDTWVAVRVAGGGTEGRAGAVPERPGGVQTGCGVGRARVAHGSGEGNRQTPVLRLVRSRVRRGRHVANHDVDGVRGMTTLAVGHHDLDRDHAGAIVGAEGGGAATGHQRARTCHHRPGVSQRVPVWVGCDGRERNGRRSLIDRSGREQVDRGRVVGRLDLQVSENGAFAAAVGLQRCPHLDIPPGDREGHAVGDRDEGPGSQGRLVIVGAGLDRDARSRRFTALCLGVPPNGAPGVAGSAGILNDRPGPLRRGGAEGDKAGHVAVVVRPGAGAQVNCEVDGTDGISAAADWSGVRVDPHDVVSVDVGHPDLTRSVHRHTGGTVTARKRHVADIGAVGAEMADRRCAEEGVGHPDVACAIHRHALGVVVAMRVESDEVSSGVQFGNPITFVRATLVKPKASGDGDPENGNTLAVGEAAGRRAGGAPRQQRIDDASRRPYGRCLGGSPNEI